jgi:hypothetical protein
MWMIDEDIPQYFIKVSGAGQITADQIHSAIFNLRLAAYIMPLTPLFFRVSHPPGQLYRLIGNSYGVPFLLLSGLTI